MEILGEMVLGFGFWVLVDSILNCGEVPRIIFLNDYLGQKNNGAFYAHHFSWKNLMGDLDCLVVWFWE